ncbi:MAG TPA: acetylornithine transaminase [Desulfobacteraceae bacterium]|nr:MAG: acetylornithine transaminase [Deltaproteobacteria bacterium]HHE74774.1 acetylornithine transaminase [Desulfobacteraceae bacterium]
MTSQELRHKADAVMMHTYNRFPVVLVKGKGCIVWDMEGRSYRDFIAGIAVCNLGHAHPVVSEALRKQAESLWHVSNLYYTVPQTELADWLTGHSFADRVFFCNSGAEANEAAIKLCRKYFYDRGEKERYRIISMTHSFHGRTMAALSATGQDKIKKGFDPILDGFDFVPFDDMDALKQKVGSSTAAVMLEPVQGEGGVRCPSPAYLQAVRKLCDDTGTLLVFDEIQTGMGRTGKLFAYEHFGIVPDVMSLAKALGNGLPIGAILATEQVASAFSPGAHATTFGGTPIVTAAALAVVKTMEAENIVAHGAHVGSYFKKKLQSLQKKHPVIEDVRGFGLLIGMQLKIKGDGVVTACLEKGFLVNCIQESVLRFAPPLIIQKTDIDALVDCLDEVLMEITI